jgi:hypothetical protein
MLIFPLVAKVAYDILQTSYPHTLSQCEDILKVLEVDYPNITVKEDKHMFVECTTAADDMKMKGWSWQTEWHYVNTPYVSDANKDISDFPSFDGYDSQNLTLVVEDLISWLKYSAGYD